MEILCQGIFDATIVVSTGIMRVSVGHLNDVIHRMPLQKVYGEHFRVVLVLSHITSTSNAQVLESKTNESKEKTDSALSNSVNVSIQIVPVVKLNEITSPISKVAASKSSPARRFFDLVNALAGGSTENLHNNTSELAKQISNFEKLNEDSISTDVSLCKSANMVSECGSRRSSISIHETDKSELAITYSLIDLSPGIRRASMGLESTFEEPVNRENLHSSFGSPREVQVIHESIELSETSGSTTKFNVEATIGGESIKEEARSYQSSEATASNGSVVDDIQSDVSSESNDEMAVAKCQVNAVNEHATSDEPANSIEANDAKDGISQSNLITFGESPLSNGKNGNPVTNESALKLKTDERQKPEKKKAGRNPHGTGVRVYNLVKKFEKTSSDSKQNTVENKFTPAQQINSFINRAPKDWANRGDFINSQGFSSSTRLFNKSNRQSSTRPNFAASARQSFAVSSHQSFEKSVFGSSKRDAFASSATMSPGFAHPYANYPVGFVPHNIHMMMHPYGMSGGFQHPTEDYVNYRAQFDFDPTGTPANMHPASFSGSFKASQQKIPGYGDSLYEAFCQKSATPKNH
uniref:Uncharacterized protein n=1 Tax=Acrobeloides nanus TaxID=290746 RepID=A0A914CXX7_9BILA